MDERLEKALQITADALQKISQSDSCNRLVSAFLDRNISPQERLMNAGKINETSFIVCETITQLMKAQAQDTETFNNWLKSTNEISCAIVKLQEDLTSKSNADHMIIEQTLAQIKTQNTTNNDKIAKFIEDIHNSCIALNEKLTGKNSFEARKEWHSAGLSEEDIKYYMDKEEKRFTQECKLKLKNFYKTQETIQIMSKDLNSSTLRLIDILENQMNHYNTYKETTQKLSFELQQAMCNMQEKALNQRQGHFQNFLNQGLEIVKLIVSKKIQPAPGQPVTSNLLQLAPEQPVASNLPKLAPGPKKFCPNCGTPDPGNFCSNCGMKFT